MQLEKGKWYKSRDGWYVAFVLDTDTPAMGNRSVTALTTKLTSSPGIRRHYTKDGHLYGDGTESGQDLVEATTDPYAPIKVKIVVEGGCVVSVESNYPIDHEIEDRD